MAAFAAPFRDPLAGFSILSLFPRTFGSCSLVVNNSEDDVDAIHFHLKALELRDPEKLLNQSKRVMESVTASSGITTTDGDDAVSKIYKDKSEVVAVEGAENPRRRRPGLGRRRAQFSLLSNASECAENIKPSQNIDISEDPDEYFARLDRLEKAERELQRQRGIALMDLDQNAPLLNARRRGPSLLGRTATYKHRFPTDWIDNENSSLPSEEALVQDVSKPPSDIMAPETADQDNSSQAATVEDQVSKVVDELLARNEDELHEDFIMNLVHYSLEHSSKIVHCKPETEVGRHEKQISKQSVDGQNLNAVEQTMEEPLRLQETDHQRSSDILNEAAPMLKQISNVTADGRVQINAARRKKKLIDLRKSLAGAGSKWESAVRRSSRIRTRPLEYWKGERLLYGRIHRTMPTVIGLKYFSPARNGGKAQVRVQSYVSDEHKDLVERVARY